LSCGEELVFNDKHVFEKSDQHECRLTFCDHRFSFGGGVFVHHSGDQRFAAGLWATTHDSSPVTALYRSASGFDVSQNSTAEFSFVLRCNAWHEFRAPTHTHTQTHTHTHTHTHCIKNCSFNVFL
jgi:hypothetical protein